MAEYLSPGVYIEEVNTGARPIEGVGTAMAAFVGFAPSGPANTPTLITSWSQYAETFGALDHGGIRNPHMQGAYLSWSVYGYLNNGGSRCYVTRIVPMGESVAVSDITAGVETTDQIPGQNRNSMMAQNQNSALQLPTTASKAVPSMTITAKGTPTSDIQIEITKPVNNDSDSNDSANNQSGNSDSGNSGVFNLRVKMGVVEELFEGVVLGKPSKGAKGKPLAEAVARSQIINIVEEKTTGPLAERAPEFGSYVIAAQPISEMVVQSTHFVGEVSNRSGLEGLEIAEDVTMLCVPDLMSAFERGMIDRDGVKAVQLAMINHCERVGGRMALIDPLPNLNPQQVKKWREQESNFDSKYAAMYYPWVKVSGADGKPMAVPPSGHMAGIWARNDVERGVHKAPANEVVRGALEPAMQITKGEQDTLNPSGINCIRSFTGMGVRLWGARTLSSDPQWRYVNVRRLFNFVEKSIERGTQWVVFEPNNVDLWERVRRDVTAFLTGVWRDGGLFGATPSQAFYVKCDEELNPQDVRDRGQLIIEIGLAPVKPAEFVIYRFQQYTGGGA